MFLQTLNITLIRKHELSDFLQSNKLNYLKYIYIYIDYKIIDKR